MNENNNCVRRCSREDKEHQHGFKQKLISDMKKIYNFEIKLKNSRPPTGQYNPTEVSDDL